MEVRIETAKNGFIVSVMGEDAYVFNTTNHMFKFLEEHFRKEEKGERD